MRTFRGETALKIDAKGRVSIPSNFRKVLDACHPDRATGEDPALIIVYGDGSKPYLEGFSVEAMAAKEAKIQALPSGPLKKKATKYYQTQTWETTVDSSGRIVLPKDLREKLRIDGGGDVYFAGTGETFQIWNGAEYETEDTDIQLSDIDGYKEGMDLDDLLDLEL